MAGNSFTVDASEAAELAADIARKSAALKVEIDREITAAGQRALRAARAAAPSGPHTRKIPGSIRVHVRKWDTGAQFTLQTQDKAGRLGAILERGARRSRPWMFLAAGRDAALPGLESALMNAVSRIVDEA
jgi:hypothetical protein